MMLQALKPVCRPTSGRFLLHQAPRPVSSLNFFIIEFRQWQNATRQYSTHLDRAHTHHHHPQTPATSSEAQQQSEVDYLGLRSRVPPDSSIPDLRPVNKHTDPPEPEKEPEKNREDAPLSDQEWEIRTGRAIDLIQRTLPSFFETGLVFCPPSDDPGMREQGQQGIYSQNIKLTYTPPGTVPLLPQTLTIAGLPLYRTSSVFVQHTMNALYTDLKVDVLRMSVWAPKQKKPDTPFPDSGSDMKPKDPEKPHAREKKLLISFSVTGNARVSGSPGRWDINTIYTMSPISGLVMLHDVDSIVPTPHRAVFEGLLGAFGLSWPEKHHQGPAGGVLGFKSYERKGQT